MRAGQFVYGAPVSVALPENVMWPELVHQAHERQRYPQYHSGPNRLLSDISCDWLTSFFALP
jgi:hypothetical protein